MLTLEGVEGNDAWRCEDGHGSRFIRRSSLKAIENVSLRNPAALASKRGDSCSRVTIITAVFGG